MHALVLSRAVPSTGDPVDFASLDSTPLRSTRLDAASLDSTRLDAASLGSTLDSASLRSALDSPFASRVGSYQQLEPLISLQKSERES